MTTVKTAATLGLAFGLLAMSAGCITGSPNSSKGGGAAAYAECGPEGMIDDGEDGNNQNLPVDNRGGYWYTFVDKGGSTVDPPAGEDGGTFAMTEGGANGSKFAACFRGKVGTTGILFGGLGMNFVDPKEAYDASKYVGISFWAKRGSGSTNKVRLKVPDTNTDPQGGVCSECFNDFGVDLNLPEQWTKFIVPFRKMSQMPDWGAPRKPRINPSGLFGIQLQTNQPGASYDVCIDDLQFVCES